MSRPASAIAASSPDGAGAATSTRSCGTSFTPAINRRAAQRPAAGGAAAAIAGGVISVMAKSPGMTGGGTRSEPALAQAWARVHAEIHAAAERVPFGRERDRLAAGVQVAPALGEAAFALK